MIEELQKFCVDVESQTKVCGTYKAYGHALQHELQSFLEALSKIESQEHMQSKHLKLIFLTFFKMKILFNSSFLFLQSKQ